MNAAADAAADALVLGVDPGRRKTGLAIVGARGEILWRAIIAPDDLPGQLTALLQQWPLARIALGNSTASAQARAHIERVLAAPSASVELVIVDESGSTLAARALYWADHPRAGWRRLLPLSLQEPPEPLDDYAAAIVARRAL